MPELLSNHPDPFNARDTFEAGTGPAYLYRLDALDGVDLDRLPVSIRILLEGLLRQQDGDLVTEEHVRRLSEYDPSDPDEAAIPFTPSRVLLQDFTGVPSVVDLAALRSAMDRFGADPTGINPEVPVHLIIDHSVQVDHFGLPNAVQLNSELEFRRNKKRYEFLKWGRQAFDDFNVVPPASGICHQVNLEYVGRGVWSRETEDGIPLAYPDPLVGMGVLPLQFADGEDADSLGLDGTESFDIPLDEDLEPGQEINVTATAEDGTETTFTAINRCNTEIEVRYYRHGCVLHYVLRDTLHDAPVTA